MEEKIIVMTKYGKGERVEHVTVQCFDTEREAYLYAGNVTADKDGIWVKCEIVDEGRKYPMRKVDYDAEFKAKILKLDDRMIRIILTLADSQQVAKALKAACPQVQDRIFGNMTPRRAGMLKEDMEYMGPVRYSDVIKAREDILSLIVYDEYDEFDEEVPLVGEDDDVTAEGGDDPFSLDDDDSLDLDLDGGGSPADGGKAPLRIVKKDQPT